VRWLPADKLHLTLVFLGPTDPARLPALIAAAEGVAGRHARFGMVTSEGGGRISDRGGVAWLRLGDGARETADLALDLDAAFGSATYDERRRPQPHLTVARGATKEVLADLRDWASREQPLAWQVDRIVLFRSHTDPGGSRYESLGEWPLGPVKTP
jgi:2'-5' RNA ligase